MHLDITIESCIELATILAHKSNIDRIARVVGLAARDQHMIELQQTSVLCDNL